MTFPSTRKITCTGLAGPGALKPPAMRLRSWWRRIARTWPRSNASSARRSHASNSTASITTTLPSSTMPRRTPVSQARSKRSASVAVTTSARPGVGNDETPRAFGTKAPGMFADDHASPRPDRGPPSAPQPVRRRPPLGRTHPLDHVSLLRRLLLLLLLLAGAWTAGSIHGALITAGCIGDYGSDYLSTRQVARLVKSWQPQFIITVGDNNYPHGEASTIDRNVGQFYHEFIEPYQGRYGTGAL